MSEKLEPLNAKIQVCPFCGKVDVYKDDGHSCDQIIQRDELAD